MAIEYNFKYMPLVGKLSGKSMAEQTETAINEIAKIVNDNTAQAEIINTLAEEANANSVEALEKANEALETSGRVYIKETGAVDLDSYCESQLIYINNIFSQNLPVESKGFLEVKTNDDKTEATQVFIDDTNKEVYTRSGAITETQVGDITTYTASYGAWNKSASTNYVENMVLIRQNSTAYSVGDIARSTALASYMLLECTSAGTTGASEPSFSGADVGDVITDGSVSWTIIEYASTDYVDDSIVDLKNVYFPANYLSLSGGTITGNVFAPTPTAGDNSTKVATTEFVNGYLPLSGGTLTGDVNGVTPPAGDNSKKIANTEFIQALANILVPTGCVQAFAGSATPNGWLLCDGSAVSRTDYAALFAVIGTTYGSGNGSTTFNVPNLVDKFIEGSATAGTVKSAGLPNISGTADIRTINDNTTLLIENTGAFGRQLVNYGTYNGVAVGTTISKASRLTLNASNSNAIYGNSTTVQPPALTMRYIIKY